MALRGVASWASDYGAPVSDVLEAATTEVDFAAEVRADAWVPIEPAAPEPACFVFVDGVRRVDAHVWVDTNEGVRQGACASYAAGAVRCDAGRAELVDARVERGVFCAGAGVDEIHTKHVTYPPRPSSGSEPQELWVAIQNHMAGLEGRVAADIDADLVIVDGPLSDRRLLANAIGLVKGQRVAYLDPGHEEVLLALSAGQRTPLFFLGGQYARWSWYFRLPYGVGHPWAGIVRCEAPPDRSRADAIAVADAVTVGLQRFASQPFKDPRAPQNLIPVGSLERQLRHRLGDARLLERALREVAAA